MSSPKQLRFKKTIRLPDIDWVEIPAGAFIYGEASAKQTLTLERFYISRYPITHCQYQTFIDADGYADERWWVDLIKPEPAEPGWKHPNRPRETVDWYEALAFTRWLSAQLGYAMTLPTEQQWEKAARGTDGREYPWGSGFNTGDANVYDSSAGDDNLRQTVAVGLYPHRSSPDQVMELAGNVWEWCLNKYDHPEQIDPDQSNDVRVLRGGSWNDDPGRARASLRFRYLPDSRDDSIGFRLVYSVPTTTMQYLQVRFREDRKVLVNGLILGATNQVLLMEAGVHHISLAEPHDFTPKEFQVNLANTTVAKPFVVQFF